MTVIANNAADSFIEQEAGRHVLYLVHGQDEGLTHERAARIARRFLGGDGDPLNLVRLEGDAVAKDPGALADEAYAISMFGGPRVIWVDARGQDLLRAVKPLFDRPPQGCAVIVRTGILKKDHPLRLAFAEAPLGVAIECYSDEQAALGRLIDGETRAAGVEIAPDARATLLALLGADRETTRGEIAKLLLHARGRPRIEAGDVEAIVSGAAPSRLDDAIDRSLTGDLRGAAASSAQYFTEGGDGEQLMARLVAQIALLYRSRLETDQSSVSDAARSAALFRLPPNARRALSRQAEAWTSQAIARRLPAILAASAGVRARPRLARLLASRLLWALSRSPAKGRSSPP
jgi:DNA polymerase III subunit delta